jgi:hypothetical protein
MIEEQRMSDEYGPFSRRQSLEDNDLVAASGELWGAAERNIYAGSKPAARAYREPLPDGFTGIEFMTEVEPGPGSDPAQVRWRQGQRGVRNVEWAEMVTRLGLSRAKRLQEVVAIPVRITKRVDR